MCLLGHALRLSLQAFRLYQHGNSDFITIYPEEDPSMLVPVIAEDDRHYNCLLEPNRAELYGL